MNGIYYPKGNNITSSQSNNDKTYLGEYAGKWLNNLWKYEEGIITVLDASKISSNDSHVYRIGNIGILKLEVTMASAATTDSPVMIFKLPWAPQTLITDRRNYGYKKGQSPVYTCLTCQINLSGEVSITSYKGVHEYCAVIFFPIEWLAE